MAVDEDTVRRFTWAIASISVHLEELNGFWGRALDISGPQWMILIALAELDQDKGVPVNAVAKKLQSTRPLSPRNQRSWRRRACCVEGHRTRTRASCRCP
jgi:hypothetical protein